jgi:hypothetical protein
MVTRMVRRAYELAYARVVARHAALAWHAKAATSARGQIDYDLGTNPDMRQAPRRGVRAIDRAQTDERMRGGWKMPLPPTIRCVPGRSAGNKEKSDGGKTIDLQAVQAQNSARQSRAPAGTGGATGCPEHQAPEQGRWLAGDG